jgi:hypothetical protein
VPFAKPWTQQDTRRQCLGLTGGKIGSLQRCGCNLVVDDDAAWLPSIAPEGLSDAQAQAMVVARRTGVVRNAILRDISRLETLGASLALRQLRDRGLLEAKGSSVATHYVLEPAARLSSAVK